MKINKLFAIVSAATLLFAFGPVAAASAGTTGDSDSIGAASILELVEGTDFQVLTPEQSKFLDENFGEEAVSLSTAQDLATGVSAGELAVAAADDVSLLADTCNSWKNQVATLGTQSTRTDTGCALIGSSLGQKTYSWAKDLNAKGSICVQGKGYTTTTEQWIIGGCGPSGAVTANWRNVLAHPAIKFEAGVAPVWGVAFKWV